jgi:nicotinamidase-related amidase
LATVLDTISCGFKAVLLEDCTAAFSEAIHDQTLNLYRRNPLYPLLRVATSAELVKDLTEKK